MFDHLLSDWDGERVVASHDPRSGAWSFVCIHPTALGPAAGGPASRPMRGRRRVWPMASGCQAP